VLIQWNLAFEFITYTGDYFVDIILWPNAGSRGLFEYATSAAHQFSQLHTRLLLCAEGAQFRVTIN
jgi:hypothetical protein